MDDNTERAVNKGNTWKGVAIVFIIFFFALTALNVWMFKSGLLSLSTPINSTSTNVVISPTPEIPTGAVAQTTPTHATSSKVKKAQGTYLALTIPENWNYTEYLDGQGTDMLVDGVVYRGLTGFVITDEFQRMLYEVQYVQGIGGVAMCRDYFQFTDTDPKYYDYISNLNKEAGFPAPETIPVTGYKEYTVLGARVRRAGKELYWQDKALSQKQNFSGFNAGCSMMQAIPYELKDVVYNDGKADPDPTYFSTLPLSTSDEKVLVELDKALQSITLVQHK